MDKSSSDSDSDCETYTVQFAGRFFANLDFSRVINYQNKIAYIHSFDVELFL